MDIERLRRALPLTAAWVAAAGVSIAVATWGVTLVGGEVTESRPAPLSVSEVAAQLEAAEATSTTLDPTLDQASTSTTAAPDPATTDGTSPTATGPTPTGPTPTGPTPTESTTRTTAVAAPTSTSPPVAVDSTTRTYSVVGGTVSLRFSSTGVTVVFANPAPGFDVEVEPEHGNGVKVEFESEDHRSRVEGWWDGGPRDRVEEDAGGDDAGD